MSQLERIQHLKKDIYQIAQRYNAGKVYVFGSCARKEETKDSDIDLLVEFLPHATLFDQVHIKDELEALLNCKVDVVSRRALNPCIRKNILAEAVAL
ncbi:MAG: nucleotidyltransferase family protein [Lentisphaerae bacterium]|jgi:predicted nucleotidyltransferase|nr:nucleotidyltransferase family protein [Lentisphaerota bacterium]